MATTITAGNATNGAAISSDNTGILELKSGTGSGTTAVTVSTGQAVTFAQAANLPNTFGFKNRIINGAMVIDQRNAGASVTAANGTYTLDRWVPALLGGGVFSVQRSTTAPAGFTNSLFLTVTTADSSLASGDYYGIQQFIEGYNVADFAYGTSSAVPVTISFWVRSSIAGTYCVWAGNSNAGKSYVGTYTINSTNTWEQKTITVSGDTASVLATENSIGLRLWFTLGGGSSFTTTAGSWQSGTYFQTSAQTQWISTNGANFYITGVQLEKGSTATSFDVRPYGTELQLAQRYYSRQGIFGRGNIASHIAVPINVNMRTTPAVTTISSYTGDGAAYTVYTDAIATNNFDVKITWTGGGSSSAYSAEFGASAEL